MRSLTKGLLLSTVVSVSPALLMAGPVDINTADAEMLAAELDGVGPALAEAIVRDREENGRYETADAIMRVQGIGPRVLEDNRENILVEDESGDE